MLMRNHEEQVRYSYMQFMSLTPLTFSELTYYAKTFLLPSLLLPGGHRFFILFSNEREDLLSVFGAMSSSSKVLLHSLIQGIVLYMFFVL